MADFRPCGSPPLRSGLAHTVPCVQGIRTPFLFHRRLTLKKPLQQTATCPMEPMKFLQINYIVRAEKVKFPGRLFLAKFWFFPSFNIFISNYRHIVLKKICPRLFPGTYGFIPIASTRPGSTRRWPVFRCGQRAFSKAWGLPECVRACRPRGQDSAAAPHPGAFRR